MVLSYRNSYTKGSSIKTYKDFLESRKNLNLIFRVKNAISCLLYCYAGYLALTILSKHVTDPRLALGAFMSVFTGVTCLSILTINLRAATEIRKNNFTLHEYIQEAIKEARVKGDYSVLNQLLDSKYSGHIILVMSKYPVTSFNFKELSQWEKLPDAITYFQKNNFTEADLIDHTKMVEYLKSVYPEFLTSLAESKNT